MFVVIATLAQNYEYITSSKPLLKERSRSSPTFAGFARGTGTTCQNGIFPRKVRNVSQSETRQESALEILPRNTSLIGRRSRVFLERAVRHQPG